MKTLPLTDLLHPVAHQGILLNGHAPWRLASAPCLLAGASSAPSQGYLPQFSLYSPEITDL